GTRNVRQFEAPFISELVRSVSVPVIAEGRIRTLEQARSAVRAGAFAVVVGSAITRPHDTSKMFALAIENEADLREKQTYFLGIDLGGTSTKSGLVSTSGELLFECRKETPAQAGREALLEHLVQVADAGILRARKAGREPSALGIATAGWVDAGTGTVVYATENLPGWTGTPIATILREKFGLPVAVENDANATALAEKEFGLARNSSDFIAITLGTGVGGGCYTRGALNRGAHFFANALGHIVIEPGGRQCTCGQRGCLEAYANAAALVRYAGGGYRTAEEVIAAANALVPEAEAAVARLAGYLVRGCHTLIQLFDPEMIVLSGGLVQNNARLLSGLSRELSPTVQQWGKRNLCITASKLGYHVGVFGAAAIAKRLLEDALDSLPAAPSR
ncbi:MAG TPA: ROK family protein, partial [Bryobacteraceae bacterium]|nr:ROK family protein [Bryobacteraceae bacterium]